MNTGEKEMCRFSKGDNIVITDKLIELVLSLLLIPRIQEAIQKICGNGNAITEHLETTGVKSNYSRGSSSSFSANANNLREFKEKNNELTDKVINLSAELQDSEKQYQNEHSRTVELEAEVERLGMQLKQECKKKEEAEKKNVKQEETLAQQEIEITSLKASVHKWDNTLGKATEALNALLSLSDEDRDSLENTFRTDELTAFIASCAKWENIESIWDYARYEFNQGRQTSREKLLCILEFCLEVHNRAFYSEPKFKWQEIGYDEDYDSDFYDKTPDSRTSGTIQKVLLPGIILVDNGEIVRKSLTVV